MIVIAKRARIQIRCKFKDVTIPFECWLIYVDRVPYLSLNVPEDKEGGSSDVDVYLPLRDVFNDERRRKFKRFAESVN